MNFLSFPRIGPRASCRCPSLRSKQIKVATRCDAKGTAQKAHEWRKQRGLRGKRESRALKQGGKVAVDAIDRAASRGGVSSRAWLVKHRSSYDLARLAESHLDNKMQFHDDKTRVVCLRARSRTLQPVHTADSFIHARGETGPSLFTARRNP